MLGEELYKRIEEAEDKAKKWDKLNTKYVEVAEVLKAGLEALHIAEEKFAKATMLMDPVAQVKGAPKRKRVTDIDAYVSAQIDNMREGKEVTIESLAKEYPDLPIATIKYIFTSRLGKNTDVLKRRNGRMLVLSMEKTVTE